MLPMAPDRAENKQPMVYSQVGLGHGFWCFVFSLLYLQISY